MPIKHSKNSLPIKEIPSASLGTTQSSLLNDADLNSAAQTNNQHARYFKPALALKKLLRVVVRYELDEKEIKAAQAVGVNPILHKVNALLMQDPSLALKRAHITDLSGHKRYWSPLEAAHWSGNWELRNMMKKHAQSIPGTEKGVSAVDEQLRAWDQQAYNYNLILMRAEKDTFPVLKKIPALIKQYNEADGKDKIFQWGDVNGEWLLTELEGDTKELFAYLDFPDMSDKKPVNMTSDQITPGMYDTLKKGHTVAHFDLDEFVRVTTAFNNKYAVNVTVPRLQWIKSERDSYKIGKTQKKFPAWITAIWCSNIPFLPVPDFKLLIKNPEVYRLKLYSGEDFYNAGLGENFSIYKGNGGEAEAGTGAWHGPRGRGLLDSAAMAALWEVIADENGKSMQLLPRESKSTPGL